MTKEELRTELNEFAKILIYGYDDDSTILEILGTYDAIDDYVDNQLSDRWEIQSNVNKLKACTK